MEKGKVSLTRGTEGEREPGYAIVAMWALGIVGASEMSREMGRPRGLKYRPKAGVVWRRAQVASSASEKEDA